jgi:hypothetical protein
MRTRFLALTMLAMLTVPAAADAPLPPSEKAALQAIMYKEIDRHTVDGAYLSFDIGQKAMKLYFPAKAHPMIMRMGKHYILCTDFRDERGQSVNVDFYMARKGTSWVVFQTEIGHRNVVEALMADGKVTAIE